MLLSGMIFQNYITDRKQNFIRFGVQHVQISMNALQSIEGSADWSFIIIHKVYFEIYSMKLLILQTVGFSKV